MTDIILGIIIIALLIGHVLYARDAQALIKSLTKAVMAKDLRDFDISEKIQDNTKNPVASNQAESEFVSIDGADSKLFERMLKQELEPDKEDN